MPQTYTVRLYQSTGFDTSNLPDSPALLNTCTYVDTAAVWLWQNRGNASIRVNAEWDAVKNTDYMRLGDTDPTYYVVTSVVMLSAKTAEMSLTRDPFLSAGGLSNITILGGWTRRAHTGDDALFGNILPEPWSPSNHLQIRNQTTIHGVDESEETLEIAVATCSLDTTNDIEARIASVGGSVGSGLIESVVWPQMPGMGTLPGTTVTTPGDGTGNYSYTMPGMYAFDLGAADVQDGINAVRSLGIESAILSMYVIPTIDVTGVQGAGSHPDHYTELQGRSHVYTPNQPYEYAEVQNRKAIALYNYYVLESVASGSAQSYEAKELYSGGTAPDWETKADPSPDGTVYCQPTYYEGKPTVMWSHAVASAPWYSAGYVYSGASGSTLITTNMNRANTTINVEKDFANAAYEMNKDRNTVDTIIGLAGNIVSGVSALTDKKATPMDRVGGVASAAVGAAGNISSGFFTGQSLDLENDKMNQLTSRRLGDNLFAAYAQTSIVAPTLAFPITVTAASYFGHAFRLTQVTLSDNDVARFDRYLTMYGYAQDKPFEHSDLTNRTKFNYILVQSAQVSVPNNNHQILNEIADALGAGLRFWHVLPSAAAYSDNPIAEV